MLAPETTVTRQIPRQVQSSNLMSFMSQNGKSLTEATNGIVASTLILNLILAASLNQLLTVVNILQLLELIALVNLAMPANVGMFLGFIMQIATFEIMPTLDWYTDWFSDTEKQSDDPLYDNLQLVGLSSRLFTINMGSLLFVIGFWPILAILHCLFKPCRS